MHNIELDKYTYIIHSCSRIITLIVQYELSKLLHILIVELRVLVSNNYRNIVVLFLIHTFYSNEYI